MNSSDTCRLPRLPSPLTQRQLEALAWVEAKRRVFGDTDAQSTFTTKYRNDPARFVRECIQFHKSPGPTDYQFETLDRLVTEKRVSVRGPHGLGKCVDWDDEVQLADGRWVVAGTMVGRCAEVPATGENLEPTIASAMFVDNGKREVIEIETKRGRVIRRTLNHPLWADSEPYRWDRTVYAKRLRPEGRWVTAGELKSGDVVAVATSSVPYKAEPRPIEHVKLAAYLLGDGGLTSGGARFTNANSIIMAEFERVCKKLGCSLVPASADPITVNIVAADDSLDGRGYPYNPILELLRRWGMYGVGSHDKRFPAWVWSLPRSQLAVFLSRLYACDGWASTWNGHGCQVGYATVSLGLAHDVSRALLRLGIDVNLLKKRTKWEHNGIEKTGVCYQLTVDDGEGCLAFAERISIFGKGQSMSDVVESALSADARYTQKWRGYGLPDGYLWEKVGKVTNIGSRRTVAITVPGVETFTTEFVEHNTAMAAWVILWFALTREAEGTDWKIPVTASAWRQLSKFLMPELHK